MFQAKFKQSNRLAFCLISGVVWCQSIVNAQVSADLSRVYEWQLGQSGQWSTAENWSPFGIPNRHDDSALIKAAGSYTIDLQTATQLRALYLLNPGTQLRVKDQIELKVNDQLVNNGTILLNHAGENGNSILRFGSDCTISGFGTIVLNAVNEPFDAQIKTSGNLVTIGESQVVNGSGALLGRFHNRGLIISDDFKGLGLLVQNSITQSSSGRIIMDGNKITVKQTASITGGRLEIQSGATLFLENTANVHPNKMIFGQESRVQIEGSIAYPFNGISPKYLDVFGTWSTCSLNEDYINTGAITLNADENQFGSDLSIEGDCTISGSGLIVMRKPLAGGPSRSEIRANSPFTLTVGADQVIEGTGTIWAEGTDGRIIMNGLVRANVPDTSLSLGGNISGGIYEADGADMNLSSGLILSDAALRALNGGAIKVTGSPASLHNVTLNSNTTLAGNSPELRLSGTIVNNGTIVLDTANTFYQPELYIESGTALLGSGDISMQMRPNDNDQPKVLGDFILPAQQTIHGAGYIMASITNQSVITATDPMSTLFIYGDQTGGIYIADNATMQLSGKHIGGEYIARNGRITFAGAEIINSNIRTEGTGDIRMVPGQDLTLKNTVLNSNLDISESSQVSLVGQIVLNGDHLLLDDGILQLSSTQFVGAGTITMRKQTALHFEPGIRSLFSDVGFGTLYVIQGSGYIQGPANGVLDNSNQVIANDPFAPLRLIGNFGGNGTYLADNAVMMLSDSASIVSTVLQGTGTGMWVLADGTASLTDIVNTTTILIPDGQSTLQLNSSSVNSGVITIGANLEQGGGLLRATSPLEISGEGVIEMVESGMANGSRFFANGELVIGENQTIKGEGLLGGDHFLLKGTLDPGGETRRFDIFRLKIHDQGRLVIDIESDEQAGQYDRIVNIPGGYIELGGTLVLQFNENHTPSFGDRWRIVSGDSITKSFKHIQSNLSLPAGQRFFVQNKNDGVDLIVTCLADRNGDFQVDFFDVIGFLNDFNLELPEADGNGDGIFDFFDVTIFLQSYAAGCSF